ncbi:MAG: allantoinase AllB [Acidobacteria bacterium]|nr:MAG: allantoinase AllB [Acidobacteriota bacterium]
MRSTRVVLADGVRAASIHVENGVIARIDDDRSNRGDLFDAGDLVILPGLVDTHVHVNEPGRTEWEGFDTATRAAAAGGVTTIVDMPLNSVPATTTVAALDEKRSAARGRCHVNVAFWGGVVPGNAPQLEPLVDAGVRGFKCFLVPSGVDEFQHVGEPELREAMPVLAGRGVPLLVHAESPETIVPPTRSTYEAYLASRPPEAEVEAIRMIIRLAREFGTRTHIVHVACAEAVEEISRAKLDRVPITAETCPHYLMFAGEEIAEGATEFKCAPPIRHSHHREALWSGLHSGALDLVATDHSPAPPALKCRGDFVRAWGGIASLEMSLAAVWTRSAESLALHYTEVALHDTAAALHDTAVALHDTAVALHDTAVARAFQASVCKITRWMCAAPAALAGLSRKGRIAAGCDADLLVFDPDAEWIVDPARLQQRHKLTPYAGRRLRGAVRTTFLRGVRVWDDGRLVREGAGRLE